MPRPDIPASMTPPAPKVESLADAIVRLAAERDAAYMELVALRGLLAQRDTVIASNERALEDLRIQLDALQVKTLEETRPFDDDAYQPIAGVTLTPNQKRYLAGLPVELTAAEMGMSEDELMAERAEANG